MSKKTVKVIVAASAGNGASTVAELLWMKLTECGIAVTLDDINYPNNAPLIARTDALRGALSVSVETIQLNRSSRDIDVTGPTTEVIRYFSQPPLALQVEDLKRELVKSKQDYDKLLVIANRLATCAEGTQHYPTDEELAEFELR